MLSICEEKLLPLQRCERKFFTLIGVQVKKNSRISDLRCPFLESRGNFSGLEIKYSNEKLKNESTGPS